MAKTASEPEWAPALDGRLVVPPRSWRSTPGAWGCLCSHLGVVEESLRRGAQSLLVLEDDLDFVDRFDERLGEFLSAVPSDWDLLYLGGEHLLPPTPVSSEVDRCRKTIRTHAIAMTATAMGMVLDQASGFNFHYDHMLVRVLGSRPMYAPHQWLVNQIDSPSDVQKPR